MKQNWCSKILIFGSTAASSLPKSWIFKNISVFIAVVARRYSNQRKEKTPGSRVVAQFILDQFNSTVVENGSTQIVCANPNSNRSLQAKPYLGKCCMTTLHVHIAKIFDITVAFQVNIKYCSVHANKKYNNYTKQLDNFSAYKYNTTHFSAWTCSARCSNPTVGDWRASANAAKVGLGWTIFSQVVSMARNRSSLFSLSVLIVSNVPGSISSSRPMLYHFTLASQVALWTLRRSLMVSTPACVY